MNGQAWTLARGDMNQEQLVHAMLIGSYEAVLLAFGIIAWVVLISRREPIGIRLALAAIAVHTGYLWYVFQGIDHLLPSTVSIWMLPETEVVFYQFSLMMPVVFLMMVRLARIRLKISTSLDVGLSLAFLVLVPSCFFILGSLIARIGRLVSWQDGIQYLLITAMVTATAFVLVVFLRLMIRLQNLIQRRSWSEWAIPLAAGLLAPLSGLALNASIPFPYDFQDGSIYVMTILNAAALLIPFRPGTRWALPGWAARAVFYPFTLFFFLVFLPFLPLSLLAMIAAGAGFLILAPLFLFTVHTHRLWEQGGLLARQRGTARVVTQFTICVLILPAAFMMRNELDRRTLNRAVDAVFSPDYQATQLPLRQESLRRALDRMDDIKHGIYLPYLSDIYNTMVFHGMVLPDEKADLIRKSLLGTEPNTSSRSGIWGSGFLGMRSRSERRGRGANVTRHVDMASQEVECRQMNDVSESEIRVVLENRGGANGEFSERITVPAGVLTTGFWLDVNGTNKFAQLRERKTATWVYEMIRDMTRRDPGLLVYEDDQHLRLRV
ncbi:MAG: MSEP-CTERM sorting domain-containing protein, partial [bacterium]